MLEKLSWFEIRLRNVFLGVALSQAVTHSLKCNGEDGSLIPLHTCFLADKGMLIRNVQATIKSSHCSTILSIETRWVIRLTQEEQTAWDFRAITLIFKARRK